MNKNAIVMTAVVLVVAAGTYYGLELIAGKPKPQVASLDEEAPEAPIAVEPVAPADAIADVAPIAEDTGLSDVGTEAAPEPEIIDEPVYESSASETTVSEIPIETVAEPMPAETPAPADDAQPESASMSEPTPEVVTESAPAQDPSAVAAQAAERAARVAAEQAAREAAKKAVEEALKQGQ